MNAAITPGPSDGKVDVLIQGAGIGGLSLAIALQKRGRSVKVVERSTGPSEVGAGIWMAPNPMQVFHRWGFAERVIQAGWVMKVVRLMDSRGYNIQTTNMSEIAASFGFETIAIHRVVLQQILHDQLAPNTVIFGCEAQSLKEQAGSVSLQLSNGSAQEAKVVIGADGINSRMRSLAGLGGVKRYSGSSSYRAIARGASLLGPEADHEAYEIWAKGCRLGFSRINSTDYYWYLTFDAPAGEQAHAGEMQAHARSLFRNYFPQWIALLEQTHPDEILRTDLSDLARLPRGSSGRIGLMGDAAHATTPNLGQGGAMAVEDALALAEAFDKEGFNESALQLFESKRRAKVDWTVNTSWSIGRMCHVGNPIVRVLRNGLLRAIPESVNRKTLQKLYSIA